MAFALTGHFALLTVAAVVGVISPGGNEVGPFLAIEQASLSHLVHDARRTSVFAWYNLAGSLAGAVGALGSGGLVQLMQDAGSSPLASYRVVVMVYAGIGGVLLLVFTGVSRRVEVISEAGGAETAETGGGAALARPRRPPSRRLQAERPLRARCLRGRLRR